MNFCLIIKSVFNAKLTSVPTVFTVKGNSLRTYKWSHNEKQRRYVRMPGILVRQAEVGESLTFFTVSEEETKLS